LSSKQDYIFVACSVGWQNYRRNFAAVGRLMIAADSFVASDRKHFVNLDDFEVENRLLSPWLKDTDHSHKMNLTIPGRRQMRNEFILTL